MAKVLSIILIVAGAVLLIYGFNAYNAVASSANQAVNGMSTDKSIWLIVAGLSGAILGGFGLMLRSEH
jgi:uncharacterized membrane protein